MDPLLKQRLVGTVVIVCLAVIFLPMILDGQPPQIAQPKIDVPAQPDWPVNPQAEAQLEAFKQKDLSRPSIDPIETDRALDVEPQEPAVAEAEQQIPDAADDAESAQAEQPIVLATQTSQVNEKDLQQPDRPAGESWVLQSGGFRDFEKAEKQRDRLAKTQIGRTFIEPLQRADGTLYRVRMGPFLKREEANKAARKILAKLNLKTLVMRYEK